MSSVKYSDVTIIVHMITKLSVNIKNKIDNESNSNFVTVKFYNCNLDLNLRLLTKWERVRGETKIS